MRTTWKKNTYTHGYTSRIQFKARQWWEVWTEMTEYRVKDFIIYEFTTRKHSQYNVWKQAFSALHELNHSFVIHTKMIGWMSCHFPSKRFVRLSRVSHSRSDTSNNTAPFVLIPPFSPQLDPPFIYSLHLSILPSVMLICGEAPMEERSNLN